MTPAEELRAAAQLVRDTAKEALGGYLAELPADWIAFFSRREQDGTLDRSDTGWIKLMHPGRAEQLAAWLDEEADIWDYHAVLAEPYPAEVRQEAKVRATEAVARVLSLAGALLGSAR